MTHSFSPSKIRPYVARVLLTEADQEGFRRQNVCPVSGKLLGIERQASSCTSVTILCIWPVRTALRRSKQHPTNTYRSPVRQFLVGECRLGEDEINRLGHLLACHTGRRLNTLYVLGNHDSDLDQFSETGLLAHPLFQRMCGPFERQIGGKRFKFMHGHEVDPVNKGDIPEWGRGFPSLRQWPEDKNGNFVQDDLEAVGTQAG